MRPRLRSTVLLAVLLVAACGHPATITTPEGQRAYKADQVVLRLGELQQAVIAAADANKVPLALAREIVTWISGDVNATPPKVGIVKAFESAPAGPPTFAVAEWNNLKARLEPYPDLATFVPIIDSFLGAH